MAQTLSNGLLSIGRENGRTITFEFTHLDYRNTPSVKEELLQVITKEHPEVLLNLQNVDFIDSTGLGLLLFCKRHCDSLGGRIALTGLKPYVSNLVCITNLHRAIPVLQAAPIQVDTF